MRAAELTGPRSNQDQHACPENQRPLQPALASVEAPIGLTQPARSQGSPGCLCVSGLPSRGESMTPIRILDETGKIQLLVFPCFQLFFLDDLLTWALVFSSRIVGRHFTNTYCICFVRGVLCQMLGPGVNHTYPTVLDVRPLVHFGCGGCHITFQKQMQSQQQKKG